ncbi:MAG: hypothetical protein ACXVB9_18450 [Bdellovibrionota bacterium]
MKQGFLTRPQLFFLSIGILALGVAWNVYQEQKKAALLEGSVPTTGTVLFQKRDSIGCTSKLPFAAADCRVVVKIRHRPADAKVDQTYMHMDTYRYLPPPDLKEGDVVTGTCTLGGLRGNCRFDQLEEQPKEPKVLAIIAVLFFAVFALVYVRRRGRG